MTNKKDIIMKAAMELSAVYESPSFNLMTASENELVAYILEVSKEVRACYSLTATTWDYLVSIGCKVAIDFIESVRVQNSGNQDL